MTSLRRRVRSRYSLVFLVVVASAFVAFAGHSLAATGLSRASGSPTTSCLTVAQSLARTAADIQAAAGKLTPVGAGIVNAAAAGAPQLAPAAAGFSAGRDQASLSVAIVATNVKTCT